MLGPLYRFLLSIIILCNIYFIVSMVLFDKNIITLFFKLKSVEKLFENGYKELIISTYAVLTLEIIISVIVTIKVWSL